MAGFVSYSAVDGAPSPWTFVVGSTFLVAVPSGAPSAVIEELWRLAPVPEVSVETLVSRLPLGEGGLASFAVVAVEADVAPAADGAAITSVVRGDAVLDVFSVGGVRRFDDRGVRPWLLADFHNVTSFVVGGSAAAPRSFARSLPGALPLGVGVARGMTLGWSLSASEADDDTIVSAAPAQPAEPIADVDDTIIRPRRAPLDGLPPAPAPAAAPTPAPAPAPASAVPRPEPLPELDEDTLVSARVSASVPAPASAAPGPVSAPDIVEGDTLIRPRSVHRIRVGEELYPLDQVTFIGRRPSSPRITDGVIPRLVTVPSPTREVSSTHVEIRQTGDSVVVTDLRSTNGTTVTLPGSRPQRLRQGESIVVVPGALVSVGDGTIVEILPASR
ncbi:FHA domain-containing protein [Compostimonas suwonensis]|uniref:PSer/pThr/pTyr-binding forkhead associated (FHA) protein n=1 Tax=Compostimonas suwonensis TaxID=1048394 RepID=A0A2M9BUE7_9MICO|nr:FHA domain-containing protein [Compostimonas suwonensis]PJJ61569.1 pSer/pThr/pTyr-binding forkhead associated (FHA) protein [Compostimonas suwonensis]